MHGENIMLITSYINQKYKWVVSRKEKSCEE